jgi:hypothetical protein
MLALAFDLWQKEVMTQEGNLVLCSGRQVGKSTIIATKAAEFACTQKGKSILIISCTERQSEELLLKVLFHIQDNYPNLLKKGRDRPTKHIIKLKNGSIIRCLPTGQTGSGIRGFTINMLIADEAAFMPEEVWLAVTPMLLTTGGQIILVSTPHGRKGYFYRCYNDEQQFKKFHINSEEAILNREISETWTELQRDKAKMFLESEKKRMSKNEYAQEYMGEFIEDLQQFFPDELVTKCMTLYRRNKVEQNKTYFLGVDIARMGEDESTYEILDRTDREHLIHVDNIITKKTYLNQVTKQVIALNEIYDFKAIYVDDGGIGVGVFDYLLDHEETKRKVVAINNKSRPLDRDEAHKKKILKEDLYNNLLALMERGEIELLRDDELFQSFKSVQFEYMQREGYPTRLRIFGNYTHIVEGLIRAAWCVKDKNLNIWVR